MQLKKLKRSKNKQKTQKLFLYMKQRITTSDLKATLIKSVTYLIADNVIMLPGDDIMN